MPTPTPKSRTVLPTDPAWLKFAFAQLGTVEFPGPKNNPKVIAYYHEAGHPEVKLDSVPWCAAFVGAMLKLAGVKPSGSLAARSYLTWGRATRTPQRGDVVVLRRGSGWQGHVFFFLFEDGGLIVGIGGNQTDSVSVKGYPKSSLLGYRTPGLPASTAARATTKAGLVTAGVSGVVNTSAQQFSDQLSEAGSLLQMLYVVSPWFMVIGVVVALAGIGWSAWQKYRGAGAMA